MIDIIITSYFRKDFTKKCIESIREFTKTPYRLIVVDNGSDKETVDMLSVMGIDNLFSYLTTLV